MPQTVVDRSRCQISLISGLLRFITANCWSASRGLNCHAKLARALAGRHAIRRDTRLVEVSGHAGENLHSATTADRVLSGAQGNRASRGECRNDQSLGAGWRSWCRSMKAPTWNAIHACARVRTHEQKTPILQGKVAFPPNGDVPSSIPLSSPVCPDLAGT
jgi:hypothetical protein